MSRKYSRRRGVDWGGVGVTVFFFAMLGLLLLGLYVGSRTP